MKVSTILKYNRVISMLKHFVNVFSLSFVHNLRIISSSQHFLLGNIAVVYTYFNVITVLFSTHCYTSLINIVVCV